MATLTIKNLPDEVYADLKAAASANRRSIIAEATIILERALGRRAVSEEELATRARQLREQTPTYLDAKELREAINEGRP